jgi:hypothetical protein
MSITQHRLRQDGLYFLQGVVGTCVIMGALALVLAALTLVLSVVAPGRFSGLIQDHLPPGLPVAMVGLLVGLGLVLWLLVRVRFVSRRLALWTMGSLGAIALLSILIAAIASP